MPLEKIVIEPTRAWALWRISEDEASLTARIGPIEHISDTITHQNKRLEWLAGRALVKEVLHSFSLPFLGITKNEYGKPFPKGYDYHLSLTHSFPFVATLMDKNESVGIDLEQPKEKLVRIAPRILHPDELSNAGSDLVKLCVYWCAKEALIKVYGQKDLVFAENLFVMPFRLHEEGDITGKIIVASRERVIPLHYIVYPNFVVVFNRPTTV